ncbi:hypothetical protein GCM10027341_08140 [Spirosoma knui]
MNEKPYNDSVTNQLGSPHKAISANHYVTNEPFFVWILATELSANGPGASLGTYV